LRRRLNIPSGTRQELCYAVHAEQNAVIQAARIGVALSGATLYCTHQPCVICAKIIINAGITRVVFAEGYPDEFALSLFKEAGVQIERVEATVGDK
jgi:dCMP deaminase